MRIYAERIMGVYMYVLFLYTIIIIFLEHLEHISKYLGTERGACVPTF